MKKLLILLLLLQTHLSYCQIVLLQNDYYKNYYDLQEKSSAYTVYEYSEKNVLKKVSRTTIKLNPRVNRRFQYGYKDYRKNINYDKGHLVPCSDYQFDKQAQLEVNYYTNVVPQEKSINRGIWRNLENYVEILYQEKKQNLIIYTGVSKEKIKIKSLKIPTYLYKLIIQEKKIIAFKIPNKETNITDFMRFRVNPTEIIELIESYNFEKIIIE